MTQRLRACALAAGILAAGALPSGAATRAARIPVTTSARVTGSCRIAAAIANSPQTQPVQIGPLTWTYHGRVLTPSAPLVQDVALTCGRGDAVTLVLPAPPPGGFSAGSTKNPLSMPFVLWVAAAPPSSCAAPPSTSRLSAVSTSSALALHFYVAACAVPKPNQESSGDYTATLGATLQL